MRSTSDNHPRSAWLFAISTTVLVLETLVRGERFPGSIDPFSSCIPASREHCSATQENLPLLPDRLQAVIDQACFSNPGMKVALPDLTTVWYP